MTEKLGSGVRGVATKGAPVGVTSISVGSLMLYVQDAFGMRLAVVLLLLVTGFVSLANGGAAQIRGILFQLNLVKTLHPKRRDGEK